MSHKNFLDMCIAVLGSYLDADEELIDRYRNDTALGILWLDLKIMWNTFLKALEADGLEDPNR